MRAVFRKVIERRVGFVTDDARQRRDEERIVGVHAAAALGLEAFGRERHLVGRIGEAFEIERDRRFAFVVGRLFAEIDGLLFRSSFPSRNGS